PAQAVTTRARRFLVVVDPALTRATWSPRFQRRHDDAHEACTPFRLMRALDSGERNKNNVLSSFQPEEAAMFRAVVEEAAALASIALFIGMIAVWVQVFSSI